MPKQTLKLSKNTRYLEKGNGLVFPWTKRLAMRKDMRELFPEWDEKGSLIKRVETAEKMANLVAENKRLLALLDGKDVAIPVDATMPETNGKVSLDEDLDLKKTDEEVVILGDLEEPFEPAADKKVTEEFLMTKEADELRKFALDVFGERLHYAKKAETLVADILELQKQMDI